VKRGKGGAIFMSDVLEILISNMAAVSINYSRPGSRECKDWDKAQKENPSHSIFRYMLRSIEYE
jgi:hypothetical protein